MLCIVCHFCSVVEKFPWPGTVLLRALATAYYKTGGVTTIDMVTTTAALRYSNRGDITRSLLTHKITPDCLNKHSFL